MTKKEYKVRVEELMWSFAALDLLERGQLARLERLTKQLPNTDESRVQGK